MSLVRKKLLMTDTIIMSTDLVFGLKSLYREIFVLAFNVIFASSLRKLECIQIYVSDLSKNGLCSCKRKDSQENVTFTYLLLSQFFSTYK